MSLTMPNSKPSTWFSHDTKGVRNRVQKVLNILGAPSDLYGESLKSDRFRLLRLNPASLSGNDLHCTLEVFDVQRPPKYVAISYTWGDPDAEFDNSVGEAIRSSYKFKTEIVVNGSALMIPTNLFNALLALRADANVHKRLPIWADAVCINQNDDSERSAQVNAMADIYMKADFAVVWLGISNQHTKRVMEIIDNVCLALKNMSRRDVQVQVYSGDLADQQWLLSYGMQPVTPDDWYAIALFLRKNWFNRAWTLQESALAQRVICLCGSQYLAFEKLHGLSDFIIRAGVGSALGSLIHLRNPQVRTRDTGAEPALITQMSKICKGVPFSKKVFEKTAFRVTGSAELHGGSVLLTTLWLQRNRPASDARDAVYSYFGIIEQIARINGLTPCPLIADYSKTPAKIYLETCRYILESTNSLGLLSLQRRFGKTPLVDLPSWACDFSSKAASASSLSSERSVAPVFDASAISRGPQTRISVKVECLKVRGLELGSVVESAVPDRYSTLKSMRLVSKCVTSTTSYWSTGQDAPEVLCKTLTADRVMSPCSNWAQVARSFRYKLIDVMSRTIAQTSGPAEQESFYREWKDGGFLTESAISDITPTVAEIEHYSNLNRSQPDITASSLRKEYRPFLSMAMTTWSSRCLFHTNDGRIGLGPESQKAGDSVWILSGGRVPFVLRQVDWNDERRYELVGEAYVHGVMYGEAVKDMRPEDWQEVVIQ